jgi:hypothetical protein
MQTLQLKLNEMIEKAGYITLNQAYAIGAELGSKQKTVERELNPSRNKFVETIKNEKHQIKGYKWIGNINKSPEQEAINRIYNQIKNNQAMMNHPVLVTSSIGPCCYSSTRFKDKNGQSIHEGNCKKVEKVKNQLF